jgi:ketosteroid isomerase-like protein
MSRETIEVVRRAYETFNRGDLEAMAADFAPVFEYIATGVIPGAGGVYRGAERHQRFVERWWGEFAQADVEVHELVDAGERVLASVTFRGRGRQSGVETTWNLWQLWSTRNGKVVRGQGFTNREEALEAAGMDDRIGG